MSLLSCRCRVVVLIVFGLVLICKPHRANAQTFSGAAADAIGGAGRAAVNAIEAHYLNPAAVAFTKSYNMGGFFQMARPSLENPANTSAFVITDNGPDKFLSGGFGYAHKRSSFPDRIITDQDFSLSLSTKILPKLSVGLSGHRLVRQISNNAGWTKHNMGIGILAVPAPIMGFSFTAYDILNDDDQDLVPVLALGSHFIIMDILRIRADITRQEKKNPDKNGTLGGGIEMDLGDGFLLRTGGLWDSFNHQTFWTGGLAWEGPNLCAAYAIKSNVLLAGDVSHTLQVWLQF